MVTEAVHTGDVKEMEVQMSPMNSQGPQESLYFPCVATRQHVEIK